MDSATPNLPPALTVPMRHMLEQVAPEQRAEAGRRFARHAATLHERLHRLYGQHSNFTAWLEELFAAMGRAIAARPGDLRAQDRAREADPEWFCSQTALGYCAYVDRFGGTLSGVAQRIPHLRELGVSYLHLLPFLRMREGENDGGFAVADFSAIEPRLGNMADLRKLTAALRGAGISLCSDFILNHVADSHPWAVAARAGDASARARFHTFADRGEPDQHERNLGQVFPAAAPGNFSYDEAMQRWVWTTFYPYQWDLNYANPEVFSAMADAMLHLANQGVEVFRLDSTAFLWKRAGTNCMNQPEVHWLLQALRSIAAIVAPGLLLKAEAIVPTAALPAYLGDASHRECHIAYHATLMASGWAALAEQEVALIEKVAAATPALPQQSSWLTYVRCHDDIGWNVLLPEAGGKPRVAALARFFAGAGAGFARGADFQSAETSGLHATNGMASALAGFAAAENDAQRVAASQRLMLLYGLAFTFGGMPLLYMGDELAQGNDRAYLDDASRAGDSRWLQRPYFDDAALALCSDGQSDAARVYQGLRHLLGCRKALPQLAAQQPRRLLASGNPAVLAYARGTEGDEMIFLANFSPLAQELDLAVLAVADAAQQRWHDVLSDAEFTGMLRLEGLVQHWLLRTR